MGKDRKKAKDDEKPAKEEPQLNQDLPDLKHIAGLGTCYMTSLAQGADGNPGAGERRLCSQPSYVGAAPSRSSST